MGEFSVGDRVRFQNYSIKYTSVRLNGEGTIVCDDADGSYGIRFDDACYGLFHTLGGRCERHHGFYIKKEDVEKYCELIEPDSNADVPLSEFAALISGYRE